MRCRTSSWVRAGVWVVLMLPAACGGDPDVPAEFTEVVVPVGGTLASVTDTLVARELVGHPTLFRAYARMRGADRRLKAGTYRIPREIGWGGVLDMLTRGQIVTVPLTIPEGFRLDQMAPRIAEITGLSSESVLESLSRPGISDEFGVPGPGLEGYLFPDTYHFAQGVSVDVVLEAMTGRYRTLWTEQRTARLGSLDLTESEVVTLASIVQAEARHVDEMPRIASVYHNRLKRGWLLQADPTVLYALGGYRERLLYAAIDSVRDNPYNTYEHPGLPPGPIGAPGAAAIDAALQPAPEAFLYFVAWPDGTHIFTSTLTEHNRAKEAAARERSRLRARPRESTAPDGAPSAEM
ncbi:MAG: endolytic transglycosylase MltG [Gemmatimonadota bacterium]|nr:endolytic transglycosylase MltG [Gemmatimonadota bacterium]MDH5758072.1 endolytic transglycosylase MltG [Gemmatimonadota bacterium]